MPRRKLPQGEPLRVLSTAFRFVDLYHYNTMCHHVQVSLVYCDDLTHAGVNPHGRALVNDTLSWILSYFSTRLFIYFSHSFKSSTWFCLCVSLLLLQSILQAFFDFFPWFSRFVIALNCSFYPFASPTYPVLLSIYTYDPSTSKKTLKNASCGIPSLCILFNPCHENFTNGFLQMNINHFARTRGSSQRSPT